MSDNVDTRVVELDFQNKNFEKSAQESIRTLGNLERALKLDGSTEGLERVEKTARDMDLSVLERSVEKVSDKFSTLGIMGVTAIQNITNKAIDAGERLIKSLSIDQIMSGYAKMDQLTTATQTLRANGYEMEQIEKELEKLMFFSDETSYSFNDMTSNLAKFTSQGLELEQSATALRGVAAWAAAAGQNSQTASRAMYNISQALGAGAMKVADWKSIELANMATSQFKELTLEAAAAVGTLTKENGKYYLQEEKEVKVTKRDKKGKIVRDAAGQAVKEVQKETKKTEVTIANFRETLKDGWFDNDTMMAVFKRYGAYSDLVQQIKDTFDLDSANQSMTLIEELSKVEPVDGKNYDELRAQLLVSQGYVETLVEAKELLKGLDFSAAYDDVSRKAYQAAQEAKTFTEAIDATKDAVSSGWMRTFQYIFGNYEQQKTLWTDVANRLWDIFAEGGDKRNSLLKKWAKTGTATVAGMITDLLDIVYNFKTLVSEAFTAVFGEITAEDLISFTDRVAGAIRSLKEFSEDADRTAKISSVLQGFARALKIVADVGGAVIKFAGNFISAFGGTFLEIALDIADFLFAPNALAEGAKNGLVGALEFTSKAVVSFADKVRTVWRNIRDFLRYLFDPSVAFSDAEKAGKQGDTEGYQRIKAVYGTVEKIRSVWDAIVKPLKATADKIQYVWNLIRYVIDPEAGKNELQAAAKSGDTGLLDRIIAAKQTARDIRTTLQTLWKDLSSAFNVAKDFVVGVLSTFGFDVSNAWTNVTSWLGRFFAGGEETEKAVSELSDKIKSTWESIKQKIIDFAAGFGIDIPSIAEAVSGFFKSLFGANDNPKSVSKLIKEKGGILIASAGVSDSGGMLNKAESAFDKGKKFGEKVKAVFEKISTFITNTWTTVSGFVSKAWNAVKPHIENAIIVIRFLFNPSSILDFKNAINDTAMLKRIAKLYSVAMRIRDLWTRLVSAVTSIVDSIKAFVAEHDILGKAGRLKEKFVKLFYDVTDFIDGFFHAFDISLPEVWNKLISGDFSGAIQKILEGLNNVSKWVSGKIKGLFVAEEGTDPKKTPLALAIAWVQNAAKTIFNAIKNTKLSNIFNSIVSYIKNTIVPTFLLISGGMFMYGVGKAAANSKKGAGIGEIMQQIAGAMLVLSASFAILGAIDEKTIETGKDLLFKFIGIVAVIKVLFFAINWLNKKFGKDKDRVDTVSGIGNEMLQIAGALAIVALSIAGLSLLFKSNKLDLKSMLTGAGVIAGAGALILGLVWLLTLIQKKIKSKNESDSFEGLGDTVLKLAGAIGVFAVLAVAIGALAKIAPGMLTSGILRVMAMGGILVVLLGALAIVQRWRSKGDDISKFGNLMLKVAGAIAIMAAVAVVLGTMPVTALIGIGEMFLIFSEVVVALWALSAILSKNKLDKSVIWNLAAYVVALIPVFAGFLLIPKDIRVEQIVAVLGGLAVAVGALIGVSWALNAFKTNWKDWATSALPSLLSLIVVMAAVVVALNFLPKDINTDSVLAFAVAMGTVVAAFVAIGAAFALFGVLDPFITAGVGAFAEIMVTLGIVVAIFGAAALLLGTLDTLFGGSVTAAIDKGVEVIISITQGLGRAVAAILTGIGLQLTQDAVTMAKNVGLVMDELKNMLENMKGVKAPKNLWRNMKSVIDIINKMSAANISDWFNSGLSRRKSTDFFKTGLKDLGEGLANFVGAVGGISVDQLSNAERLTEVADSIADITTKISGIVFNDSDDDIYGKTMTLNDLSGQLETFGKALNAYVVSVNGLNANGKIINADQIDIADRVTDIGKKLADIAAAVSQIEGYNRSLDGKDTSIAKFSADIQKLGDALREYIIAVNGFAVKVDTDAGTEITGTQFTDQQTSIADKVTVIGGKLVDIADAISGIETYNSSSFDKANSAITRFSDDITKLGDALRKYVIAVNGFDVDTDAGPEIIGTQFTDQQTSIADKVTVIGGKLVDIADAISGIETYNSSSFDKANSAISRFSGDITKLGDAFRKYVMQVNGFALDEETGKVLGEAVKKIDNKDTLIAKQVTQIGTMLSDIAKNIVSIDADQNGEKRLGGSESALTGFSKELEGLGTAFHKYVKNVLGFGISDSEMSTLTSEQIDLAGQVQTIVQKVVDIDKQVTELDNDQSPIHRLLGFHNESLTKFGNQLPDFGESLGGYVSALGEAIDVSEIDGATIDLDKIEKMTNIAVSFADFIGKLPKEGGLVQTIFGGSQWKDLATNSKEEFESFGSVLGDAVSAFSLHLSDFADPKNVENAKIASDIVSTFASAMTIFGTVNNPTWSLKEFTSQLASVSFDEFDSEIAEFAAQFVGGIGSIIQALSEASKDEDYAQRMIDVGKDILRGLLEGLSDKSLIDELISQMKYIADNLEFTIRVATETESPSKLFERIGGYLMEGFALGIRKKADEPVNEMSNAVNGITRKLPKPTALRADVSMSDVWGSLAGLSGKTGGLDVAGVVTTAVSGVIDSGIEKITDAGKKLVSGVSGAIEFLSGSSDSLIDGIAGVFGSSGDLSLDKLMDKLKGVLPEGLSEFISDQDWKKLVDAITGSDSALDKSFISGWLKGILDELTSMDNSQKSMAQSLSAPKKDPDAGLAGEYKHTGNHKWSSTPTKAWQIQYATYAEQKKHGYSGLGTHESVPQVVRTYRADGTLARTSVEDRYGYTYRQRQDGSIYAVDKMGNSLTPIQNSAEKAKMAFEQLNDTLNGTASASAAAASRAAEQAKPGNQNETDKGVSDAVVKLNKDVTGGLDTMKRELVDEVGDLSESIRGLRVVLDDGTLVGKILPAIDRGLGVRASKKDRMYYIATP